MRCGRGRRSNTAPLASSAAGTSPLVRSWVINSWVGTVEIVVPPGMDVSVDASAGVGGIEVFGRETGGFDVQQDGFVDGGDEVPDMTIEVDLGIGQVTVREQ